MIRISWNYIPKNSPQRHEGTKVHKEKPKRFLASGFPLCAFVSLCLCGEFSAFLFPSPRRILQWSASARTLARAARGAAMVETANKFIVRHGIMRYLGEYEAAP